MHEALNCANCYGFICINSSYSESCSKKKKKLLLNFSYINENSFFSYWWVIMVSFGLFCYYCCLNYCSNFARFIFTITNFRQKKTMHKEQQQNTVIMVSFIHPYTQSIHSHVHSHSLSLFITRFSLYIYSQVSYQYRVFHFCFLFFCFCTTTIVVHMLAYTFHTHAQIYMQ